MRIDEDEDIASTRETIEMVATKFNISFLLVMSCVGSIVLLVGLCRTTRQQIEAIPESVLLLGIGLMGFSLFFPWFTLLYFSRHLLYSIKRLERRIDKPWQGGDSWSREND